MLKHTDNGEIIRQKEETSVSGLLMIMFMRSGMLTDDQSIQGEIMEDVTKTTQEAISRDVDYK